MKGVFLLGKLLFDSQPLVIDRTLAKVIGLNESIILQQIHYWLEINAKKKINFHKGKYWTYNSSTEWQENDFIFWSVRTIERIIKNLEEMGLLITDNFNVDRRDRTKWYTINYDKLDTIEQNYKKMQTDNLSECKPTDCRDASTQNDVMANRQLDVMHSHNLCAPLPENSTKTSSDNTILFYSIWNIAKEKLNKLLPEHTYNDFIATLQPLSYEGNIFVFLCPDDWLKSIVEARYMDKIHMVLSEVSKLHNINDFQILIKV
jgi:hypothetical protein